MIRVTRMPFSINGTNPARIQIPVETGDSRDRVADDALVSTNGMQIPIRGRAHAPCER